MIAGTAKDKAPYFVQGTTLESSRTENPADSAALVNRRCPQMKLLLDGRCSHQVKGRGKLQAIRRPQGMYI
jgi:hypothetical protein